MIGWISLGFSLVALALAGFTFHFNYLKPFVLKCSVGRISFIPGSPNKETGERSIFLMSAFQFTNVGAKGKYNLTIHTQMFINILDILSDNYHVFACN